MKRTRDVNFGDRTILRGAERKPLAEISVAAAQPFTVYATARVEPASAPVLAVVAIEWGHGGTSVSLREAPVYRRLRVPVVGSTVRVSGRLVALNGGASLPKGVVCHVAAFIAPGSDGETLRSTRWIAQRGSEGLVSGGAEQLVTVEGYPANVAARWVMLFDAMTRPADGAFPQLAAPARRAFRRDRFDTQGFRFGVYWAASSTPMTLTYDASADVRVDVEVLT
jgi:hypothetical protein